MTDPTVRPATPGDVPAIGRIADAAWRAAYGEFLPETVIDDAMAEWYDPDVIRDAVAREGVGYFVAETGAGSVGYVSGGPSTDEGEGLRTANLGAINVDPDRWGEGIGSALLARFEGFCRDRGADVVRARVLAKNGVGQPFYRARGYDAVTEQEAELFGTTVRERIFRRRL